MPEVKHLSTCYTLFLNTCDPYCPLAQSKTSDKVQAIIKQMDEESICDECGGDFSQHYADCEKFGQGWPYQGVFFGNASHPVAVFCGKQQAETYAKEFSGGEAYEIRPVQLWIKRPEAIEAVTSDNAFSNAIKIADQKILEALHCPELTEESK